MQQQVYVNQQCIVNKKGYITLISLLLFAAVGLATLLSLVLLGVDSSRAVLLLTQSIQARVLADTCAEVALEAIRDSSIYTGTNSVSLGGGNCTYTITAISGEQKEIQSTGTVGTVVRKVEVAIDQISPTINVTSWQEVADF